VPLDSPGLALKHSLRGSHNRLTRKASGDDRRTEKCACARETRAWRGLVDDDDCCRRSHRCTAVMIKHHGDTADIEAARRADEYLAKGELDGQRVWMRIVKAIDELRTVKPGETKN